MRLSKLLLLLVSLPYLALNCRLASAQMDITTWQVNTSHIAVNPTEQKLTPGFVQGLGNVTCLFAEQVDGQVNAQPLYLTSATLSGLPGSFPDSAQHNAVYVATQNGTVYAIDGDLTSDSCSGVHTHYLWSNHLINYAQGPTPNGVPEAFADIRGAADISPLLGLTETPVIDRSTGTLYVVVEVKDTVDPIFPANAPFGQILYALDVKTGAVKGFLNLTPEFNGDYTAKDCSTPVCDLPTPSGPGKIPFFAEHQHLRSGLTLDSAHQTLYLAFASHNDQTPFWGLVLGYNISNLNNITLQGEFNTTPVGNDQQSGVWMGGASPALDPLTNQLFFATGNGTWKQTPSGKDSNGVPFTTGTDFGMSVLSLSTDPSTIVNYRGQPEMRVPFTPADGTNFKWFTPSQWNEFNNGDRDLGSGGVLLLPPLAGASGETRNLMLVGGKAGILYLLDRTNLGGNTPDPNDPNLKIINTPNPNAVQQIIETGLPQIFNTPNYFNGNIYYGTGAVAVNQRTVGYDPTVNTFISSTEISSTGGVPNRSGGNFISASSPTTDGVVWQVNNGIAAWDARNVTNTIYNSSPALPDGTSGQCQSAHWALPIVDNGKIYFSCYQAPSETGTISLPSDNKPGYLFVYGPAPLVTGVPVETATNLTATANSSTQITLNWSITITSSPSDIGSYTILRSTGNANNFGTVGTASNGSTSFVDLNVSPNTTYFYEVRATNQAGAGVSSGSASATTFPQFEEQGLVAYWPLDEGVNNSTSMTSADVTGHGHTATKAAGTAEDQGIANGLFNGAWTFHGTHALDELVVTDAPDLEFTHTQSFTLAAWVLVNNPQGSGEQPLPNESAVISKSADQGALYGLYINSDGNWAARGPLGDIEGPAAVANTWTHLALVQDGAAGTRSFYVNGQKQQSTAPAQDANGQGDLWFGDQNATLNGVQAVDGFAGNLDEVRIYNRALSQSDINDLMADPILQAVSLQPSGSQTLPVLLFPSAVPLTEPRVPANQTYTIQVAFATALTTTPQVTLQGQAGVASVTGQVGNVTLDSTKTILTVQLTGVGNAQALDLHISNINSPGVSNAFEDLPFNILYGDVSQDHKVDSFDSAEVTLKNTGTVNISNAIFDLNEDGVIDANDVAVVTQNQSAVWTSPGDTNLAFFKPAFATSVNGNNVAARAFDNDVTDNWESTHAGNGSSNTGVAGVDPSFLYVDLGAPATVDGFAIQWGPSAALDYTIDACTGTVNSSSGACSTGWQNMVTATNGANNKLQSYNDLPPVTAEFFRMNGTVRVNAPFGYQIDEFYVFGSFTPGSAPPPGTPAITSSTTASATVGQPFSYTITSNPTAASFGATGLPAGLSLSGAVISGTPTAPGPFSIHLSATNSTGQTGTATLSLTVNAATPVITSVLSQSATVGQAFSYTITSSPTAASFGATGLPAGLSLSGAVISGTPTASGPFSIALSATNSTGQTGAATLRLTVNAVTPVITSSLTQTATVGQSFSYTITSNPSAASFGATGLPAGLSLSGAVISGTPTASGPFSIALSATNSTGQTGMATLSLTVNNTAPPVVPSAPANLTATAVSSSQINLSWTASTPQGVTYSVFRSTTSGFVPSAGNQIAQGLTATTDSDTGLSASTSYFYLVEAVNGAGATASTEASAQTLAASGLTEVIAINAGSATAVTATNNTTFIGDTDFAGGNDDAPNQPITIPAGIANIAAPAAVYADAHQGVVTYTIPNLTAGNTYTVVLHFAELFFSAANSRMFNMSINGTPVLANFDIYAEAGNAGLTAAVETIPNISPVNGQIVIAFSNGAHDQPMVNGIEIQTGGPSMPSAPTMLTATTGSSSTINLGWTASVTSGVTYSVFRSTAAGFVPSAATQVATNLTTTSYSDTGLSPSTMFFYKVEAVDSTGVLSPPSQQVFTSTAAASNDVIAINAGSSTVVGSFIGDTDFVGGNDDAPNQPITIPAAIANIAAPAAVYADAHQGGVTYTIPNLSAARTYTVVLHFAELFFSTAGLREFNVAINQTPVLADFDIFAAAGNARYTAVVRSFANITPVNGNIVIAFTNGKKDQPMVNGIEIQ
jgi:large repetitive protein